MELWQKSVSELARAVSSRECSAADVAQSFLHRINAVEPKVNAFLNVDADGVMDAACEVDKKIASGENPGPLAGVPIAVKDNMCVEGVETTCASRILEGYKPVYTATAVQKLRSAGAILLGKTNMDEFAMGSSCENSAFKPTANPWSVDYSPGGSSGGSAAAVASGSAPGALGSDTGGSIRQPACFCGIVGLKPTYGRVSRHGLVAFGSSLDQIGSITRSVDDAALLFQVICGSDHLDSTSERPGVPEFTWEDSEPSLKGKKLGLVREYIEPDTGGSGSDKAGGVQPDVASRVREAVDTFKSLGAEIVEVSLPHTKYGVPTYYVVATAEASSNLARYDGVRYGLRKPGAGDIISMYSETRRAGFGPEVKRRIMLGTYVLSAGYYDAYYLKALKVRNLIKQDFDKAFEQVDYLLGATSPTVAFKLGERIADPLAMYLADVFTISANLAGVPAISIPCGFGAAPGDGSANLPVGLQITARHWDEAGLLRCAKAFEAATEYHKARPPIL